MASASSSAGFGSPGALQPTKARRQFAFAASALEAWPQLGRLASVSLGSLARPRELGPGEVPAPPSVEKDPGWLSDEKARAIDCVDPACPFWRNGQAKYFGALARYLDALQACGTGEEQRRELLADLGFHVIEDFLTQEEESALLDYWSPDGPIYPQGADEHLSHRRFFHYGPILPKVQGNTTKSTLGVTPAVFGAMPLLVERQGLRKRICDCCQGRVAATDTSALDFDQMYVNHYDAQARARIDFHHDHHITMRGIVAGVSCGSACELRIRAQDPGLRRPPARVQLPPRSLYLMSGLSRWHLQHAIPVLRGDRLSLTFRTVDPSSAPRPLWGRGWDQLSPVEAQNAHWPLLRPDGSESGPSARAMWERRRAEAAAAEGAPLTVAAAEPRSLFGSDVLQSGGAADGRN